MDPVGLEPLRYVALGDSFTIGTAVPAIERWPDQLVARVAGRPRLRQLELVANLAVNGYTSADVIAHELPAFDVLDPEFASLLIGVNDVVQRVPEARFRGNLERILEALLGRLPASRILLVTTPDYTVTPQGAAYGDPETQRAAIRRNNELLAMLGTDRGLAVVDIWDISAAAAEDPRLVAGDGLHPSGEQYRRWVDRILLVAERLLGPDQPGS